MKILQLGLENWRNFTRVDVKTQQRVFLAGPNASGKSNFLDAIRFLQDIASVGGGLQDAVRKRGGVSKIRSLAARRTPDVVFRLELGADEDHAEWEYEIAISQDNQSRPFLKRELVVHQGETRLNRPDDADRADKERLTQTHLEQVSANKDFRPIAELLGSVHYLHIVPHLVRDPGRAVHVAHDPYGSDFMEQIAETNKRTRESRLRRISDALRVVVPQLTELRHGRDERGIPHIEGRYEHWRPNGAWQAEDQFSDGTLRLLGLLWAVLDGTGPLLLEEPELSLHPAVVEHIPQMLARLTRKTGRQIIVSTHSADLLREPGIEPGEVLLLYPGAEGTRVESALGDEQIKALLAAGENMADAVMPRTAPKAAHQLALFGSL